MVHESRVIKLTPPLFCFFFFFYRYMFHHGVVDVIRSQGVVWTVGMALVTMLYMDMTRCVSQVCRGGSAAVGRCVPWLAVLRVPGM